MTNLYKGWNDYELLYLIHDHNEVALDLMLKKYQNYIEIKLSKHRIPYGEREDFVQEGLLLLVEAIEKYQDSHQTSFFHFFDVMLNRKFSRLIGKHYQYHETVNYLLLNTKEVTEDAFEELMSTELVYAVKKTFTSALEQEIYDKIFLKQQSIPEFCKQYGYPVKKVYNAIYQMRKKCTQQLR